MANHSVRLYGLINLSVLDRVRAGEAASASPAERRSGSP